MLIAITAEENNGLDSKVSSHFGYAAYFILIDTDNNQVHSVTGIVNPFCGSHGCGQVGRFLAEQGVQVMLSGGMGRRATQALQGYGIEAITGAAGNVRETLQRYLTGELRGAMPCPEEGAHGRCHD